ncbi:sugar phosphate nucleotidyltransferase [Clostridium sp. OS1-26]|uniref:sugar phosphate nucleotidyltransferase n=1 Tax=Clostridium sp. OS1-26 TaxID=3070681 RepID=UPI0027E087E5|nr:sugar phosphate nucleotidyltransferase [Clostridium sp. OS1-26]WML35816.1 sugar phosphate nucleotidyltransferase [Clostridium sp. OS1-26]
MIDHSIAKMKQAGINDIMIILGKEHMGVIANSFGSGYEYGVNFTYRIQDQPGGIAHALGLCEDFVDNDKCVVILGDNIFADNIREYVSNFEKQDKGAKVLIKPVKDPERYGIAELRGDKIINIDEKPKVPKSNYCVTGIYMYDCRVFNIIKNLKPSSRGELEITDVNNSYIKDNTLTYDILQSWWIDAGTFQSLAYANELSRDMDLSYILSRDYKIL